jgi:hypothetical protein
LGLVLLGIFWSVSAYAEAIGNWSGRDMAAHLGKLPSLVLYSKVPLGLDHPGVVEEVIGDEDGNYRYRYAGLKLLLRSGDKLFILPQRWTAEHGKSILIQEGEGIRVEFAPGDQ